MRSRWYEFKPKAIQLRKKGYSIPRIERTLRIPRSTLSGWFRDVHLTMEQRRKIIVRWKKGLVKARKKAVHWHHKQKEQRHAVARNDATRVLRRIDTASVDVRELALAMLYLGEGSKQDHETALGSTDPTILRFFLKSLKSIYRVDSKQFRFELALRADQNPEQMKRYWSRTLKVPSSCFRGVNIDQRTRGSKTYPKYKGVCHIRCSRVHIQRRLLYLARMYCSL